MQKLIYTLLNCDNLKGFLANPEGSWFFSKIKITQKLGKYLARKNKKKRLKIIQSINDDLPEQLLISIILPVLNAENTIKGTIESIQNQTYHYWELLVVDDGSTDDSIRIITELSKLDTRIKIYRNKKNKGAAYSRNVGLWYAKGDYITFHDADDTSHIERLEYQLSELIRSPKLKLVVTQYVRVNNSHEILLLNGRKKRNYISGMMIKKDVLSKVGYIKLLKISEDSEYYERIVATFGKKSRKILCKTLYYALFNPNSLLFSNANISINNNSIDYKIVDKELEILTSFRIEHKEISKGRLSPYQTFEIDKDISLPHNE